MDISHWHVGSQQMFIISWLSILQKEGDEFKIAIMKKLDRTKEITFICIAKKF